ncbi:ATPase, T2SS/T4P/T4SS family, partial [Thermogutta sp.]
MKIWYNRINESRRTMIEVDATEVWIGRDSSNTVVLPSPLVSRRHAVVRLLEDGRLQLENLGLNSCLVGEEEILGGQTVVFTPGTKVRIWPFTLTFEAEKAVTVSRQELEAHLRSLIADLELRIHRKLLERLDLYEFENRRTNDPQSILLLENNIEDICRDLRVFEPENEPILEEITGLVLRDYLVNSLIMESGSQSFYEMTGLSGNEFDIPATLVPEREAELAGILNFIRERLRLSECRDTTEQVQRIEDHFSEAFQLVRPHLHSELRKYLILRTLKKDLKDTIFGFGPLQDLLRADSITEIMVVGKDQIYVERNGVIEKSGRRFISDKVTEAIIERIVAQVGRRIDKSQPLVDARLPDGSRVNAIIPPLAV